MLRAALLSLLGLTPAYGASTDTPLTIDPQETSVVREIPEKQIVFKAQDTVKDIRPKEERTRLLYGNRVPPEPVKSQPSASPKKKEHADNIPLTSMQVRDNQEEPEHPQFLDKTGDQKEDIHFP